MNEATTTLALQLHQNQQQPVCDLCRLALPGLKFKKPFATLVRVSAACMLRKAAVAFWGINNGKLATAIVEREEREIKKN